MMVNLSMDRIFRNLLPKSYVIRILFAFFEVPSIPWKPVIAGFFQQTRKIRYHQVP
jgi:hypothetical protein